MKHIYYILTATVIWITAALPLKAQTDYQEGQYINIGPPLTRNPNYGINAYGFTELNMGGNHEGQSLLNVDVDHTFCYMTGRGWVTAFYNADTRTYNNVRALSVLLTANGEFYDDWTGPLLPLPYLAPVTYRLANEPGGEQPCDMIPADNTDSAGRHIGFIAQDVEKVMPGAVSTDADGKQTVNYLSILPVALKSIQTLHSRIEANAAKLGGMTGNVQQ